MLDVAADWDNLDAAFDELERECAAVTRGIAVELWNQILHRTPQYYGRMVTSYTFSIGTPVFVDRSEDVTPDEEEGEDDEEEGRRAPIFHKGSPTAIGIANLHNIGNDTNFKLGDTIYIANGVDHGEGPYSGQIEDGNIFLRPANRPGMPAKRSIDALYAKYGQEVAPSRVIYLKGLRIGI